MHFRNLFFSIRNCSTQKTQIISTGNNIVNPEPKDPIAFGYYFPKQWNQHKIYSLIDPAKTNIISIKIVQNKFGKSSGKIMFTFKNLEIMKKYIERYNEDFIQTQDSVQRVVLKQFQLNSQQKKRENSGFNKKYGVKLTNLDFDIDRSELVRLAEDFGEIEHIELPMKENGLNTGIAKIYFKNKKSSQQFKEFTDDLKYKQRKFKSTMIKDEHQRAKERQIKVIEAPKIVMRWNEDLYKRMVKKEAQKQVRDHHQSKVY